MNFAIIFCLVSCLGGSGTSSGQRLGSQGMISLCLLGRHLLIQNVLVMFQWYSLISSGPSVNARVVFFTMQWDPPTLEQVSKDMVDQYFCRLSEFEPDLDLPTSLREAFNQSTQLLFLSHFVFAAIQLFSIEIIGSGNCLNQGHVWGNFIILSPFQTLPGEIKG